MYVFDIESNGLLDTISKLQCINAIDRATGREYRYTDHEFYQDLDGSYTDVPTPRDGTIQDGITAIENASCIAGHHIIGYDIPAIKIVYPDYNERPDGQLRYDSKVASQVHYPDLKDKDWTRIRKGKLKADFGPRWAGSHSLYPWGIRLGGESKSDFKPGNYIDPNTGKKHTWATIPFIQDEDEYCMQDVRANVALIEHFERRQDHDETLELEFDVADIICWQETIGVPFDVKAGEKLAKELYVKLNELETVCRKVFAPFYLKDGQPKTFKKNMKRKAKWNPSVLEWVEGGATVQPVKLVDFNPGSRRHIALCLTKKYDWEPSDFTPKGQVKIDEEILNTLPFPEAKQIAEYMTVQKRLSQLAEGKQAWLKVVKQDGRIYGRVNQLGCVTGRMSHFGPNLAQVPANDSVYGPECRALFVTEDGRVIVGCDADALELRVLAHFMARFDGGAYIQVVLNGNKAEGTDMHTRNQKAIGLLSRAVAKTFFYAMLYGSGNFNLGTIVISDWTAEKAANFYAKFPAGQARQRRIAKLGGKARAALLDNLPALKALVRKVAQAAGRGYLKGLDGRAIPVRSAHAALNSLCQSAGAVVMKKALVIMFERYRLLGLDVRPLLNVHDEVQLSCLKEEADEVGRIASDAIKQAGEEYSFRCPLAGDFAVGTSWAETH